MPNQTLHLMRNSLPKSMAGYFRTSELFVL